MPDSSAEAFVRFMNMVSRGEKLSDCWSWTGNRPGGLYGHFSVGTDKTVKAHRWIYQHVYGKIPNGLIVRHKCDNPPCVNPLHLEVGTHKDNQQDKIKRGRGADRRGTKHPLAKLKDDDVREIRRLAACKVTQAELAERFGVRRGQIGKIIQRINWRHI